MHNPINVGLFAIGLIMCSIFSGSASYAQAPDDRAYLAASFTRAQLAEVLQPRDAWHPFPTINDRAAWDALPEAVRRAHVAEGEAQLGADWTPLPASVFLDYVRDGNRSRFEALSFGRRARLAKLVLAEVVEDQGRFLARAARRAA
jgi:hypothetical protein